jgi:hypothetical protein
MHPDSGTDCSKLRLWTEVYCSCHQATMDVGRSGGDFAPGPRLAAIARSFRERPMSDGLRPGVESPPLPFRPNKPRPLRPLIEAAKQLIQQEIFNASNAHGEAPPPSPHRVVNGAIFLVNLGRRCTHASFQWAVYELLGRGLLRIRPAQEPQYVSDVGGHGYAIGGENGYLKDPSGYISLGLYVLETTDQLFYGDEGLPKSHEPAARPASPPDTSELQHAPTNLAPAPAEPDDALGVLSIRIHRADRPEGFPEDRWEELTSLRTLLAAADRFLNARSPHGGRSIGPTFLDGEQREILNCLMYQPGRAAVRMHHKARDLAGNLRRDCTSIQLPECPPLPSAIPAGDPDHVVLAVRDAVPALRDWLRDVEAVVRQWAAANRPPNDRVEEQRPSARRKGRTGRPRLEDCSDPSSRARLNLYRIINRRRQEAVGRSELAQLLDAERDVRHLAKEAGFIDGVTAEVVRQAEQFARNRQKDPPAENSAM